MNQAKRIGNSIVYKRKKNFRERLISLPKVLYGWKKWEQERKSKSVGNFILKNRKLLVIVVDPETDKLICGYQGKVVINQIKSEGKKKTRVLKDIMSHTDFETTRGAKRITEKIDNLIIAIAETLNLKLKDGNQIYQWLDGALYNISKSIKK